MCSDVFSSPGETTVGWLVVGVVGGCVDMALESSVDVADAGCGLWTGETVASRTKGMDASIPGGLVLVPDSVQYQNGNSGIQENINTNNINLYANSEAEGEEEERKE